MAMDAERPMQCTDISEASTGKRSFGSLSNLPLNRTPEEEEEIHRLLGEKLRQLGIPVVTRNLDKVLVEIRPPTPQKPSHRRDGAIL
jgi:hypothetical protein